MDAVCTSIFAVLSKKPGSNGCEIHQVISLIGLLEAEDNKTSGRKENIKTDFRRTKYCKSSSFLIIVYYKWQERNVLEESSTG